MKKSKQPTQEIIKQVIGWILESNSERDIKENLATKYPGEPAQQAIAAAVTEILDIGKEDKNFTQAWCLAASKELVRKLQETGDYTGALRGIKMISQLTTKEEE